MALSKSVDTVDAWQEVAQNVIVEGAIKDLSGCYQVILHIDAALTSITATTNGLRVIIQISSATSGDNNWTELTSFGMLSGYTATKASVANTLTAGEASVISVNALAGFTTEGVFVYIDDGASSEIVFEKAQSATAISILDNVVYGHASTTPLYVVSGVAGSSQGGAATIAVNIPDTANRVRVVYDNTQDAAGSTVDVRCNLSKITGV
jgi:hypothetical protein